MTTIEFLLLIIIVLLCLGIFLLCCIFFTLISSEKKISYFQETTINYLMEHKVYYKYINLFAGAILQKINPVGFKDLLNKENSKLEQDIKRLEEEIKKVKDIK